MIKKLLAEFVVEWSRPTSNGCAYIGLKRADGEPLPVILPGQFVEIRIDNAPGAYLRRPISVCDVCHDELVIFVKDVGVGSHSLVSSKSGDRLNIVLPLGHGFTPAIAAEKVLLVGGGVGAAPLVYLSKALADAGANVTVALGGRSAADVDCIKNEYAPAAKVAVATDDGSEGVRGLVTALPEFTEKYDRIYVCGPTPMMKAVAHLAAESDTWCEVSLENHMACGIGACLCCVEKTKEGNLCVCTQGPVFNINRLLWQ